MLVTKQHPSAPFLNLPRTIRARIYRLRAEDDELNAAHDRDLRGAVSAEHVIAVGCRDGCVYLYAAKTRKFYDCRDLYTLALLRSYNTLRLVNKTFNKEILAVICARYMIFIHGSILSWITGRPYQQLLRQCRRLIIHLGHVICDIVGCRDAAEWPPRRWTSAWSSGRPLPRNHDMDILESMQKGWQELATYLSKEPEICDMLDLGLCFYAEEIDQAKLYLSPLLQLRVSKCFVRILGLHHTDKFLELARQASSSCTYQPNEKNKRFRLLDLPAEVRQHILGFTDLVTPLRQVVWTHPNMFYLPDHHTHALSRCGQGLFCRRSSVPIWPPCACFVPPTPVFLVCRTLYEDAVQVFYSRNRFIVFSSGIKVHDEIRKFFTSKTLQNHFRHIRDLEIVSRTFDSFIQELDAEGYSDWIAAVDDFARSASRGLRLAIHLGERPISFSEAPFPSDQRLSEWPLVHDRLVSPLAQLRPLLRTFFVFVVFPWPMDPTKAWAWPEQPDSIEFENSDLVLASKRAAYEARLETIVMGEHYSSQIEKKRRWTSHWDEDDSEDEDN